MSYHLWKYFFEDDVEGFRQHLANATFDRYASTSRAPSGAHLTTLRVGSPGATLATSPKTPKARRVNVARTVLTRSDINARDTFGRTLLHHAVSSSGENALEFVRALVDVPLLDLYIQDTESGWTALHRALYFGNIASAQLLIVRDIQNAVDYTTNISHVNAGGLVKIKDHEGNSPFELFSLTTAPRDLREATNVLEAAETASVQSVDMDDGMISRTRDVVPATNLQGDEVFAFGSNKNITLGLGDADDRTFPERIQLVRPNHLLKRLLHDFQQDRDSQGVNEDGFNSISEMQDLPTVVKYSPILVQDVVMAKLHTAVLTQDPVSNLHICGFGPGGRLGTGDEATRFSFECIQGGGLAKRKVASVALGQDHTVAICSSGEVFTWGSNRFGQLGYELPEVIAQEVPMQLTPRQIYGLIKKEQIIGAAASALHSVIYTASGLYTFGKNEGQLGLMDADARSLEIQILPRRIAVSVIQQPIQSVEAIDRATAVLLENHEVIVFTHFGWTKVLFPLDSFGSSIASDAFFTRHNKRTKHVSKITSGGNTICALTSYGEVFSIDVPKHADAGLGKSTTNPTKARNALPTPSKIWSIRKAHMAATDVAVGQDGSIILCTAIGTVWKKEKRANINPVQAGRNKPKLYKFVRVPNIFRAIAVRSNSFGAFTAIRQDCDVMREQIVVGPPNIWDDLFKLLSFDDYGLVADDEATEQPHLRFWKPLTKGACPALVQRAILMSTHTEADFIHIAKKFEPLSQSDYDVWVTSTITDVRLPVHSFMLKSRSKVLRRALASFTESYYFSIPDILSIEYGSDGQIHLCLLGADLLTVANFVLYLYTDTLAEVWRFTSKALHLAPRYRAVRTELMKIATVLDMKQCERAVRVMDVPVKCLKDDFESAFHDSDLFSDANVVVDLADGEERYAHSVVLQARCPFFEGMFQGHTRGMWLADRRHARDDELEAVRIDLKHVNAEIFEIVLRHIYADTGDELFDNIVTKDLDEFIDILVEVMAVANELMLDRLARICQKTIGGYITPWNVCGLLNTIAESSETEFKLAGLEYIALNLENMLDQRLLEELDEDLLQEMSDSIHSNQLAYMPISRSSRAYEVLLEQDPTLVELLEQNKQRRLDTMKLPSRYVLESVQPTPSARSDNRLDSRSRLLKSSPVDSPSIAPLEDLPFEMDDVENAKTKLKISSHDSPELNATGASGMNSSGTRSEFAEQMQEVNLGTPSFDSVPHGSSFEITPHPRKPEGNAAKTWARPTSTVSGIGLKDIMQQDFSVKVSSLTQSLQRGAASSPKLAMPKMSQKERKRQQHEQKLQTQSPLVEQDQGINELSQSKGRAPPSPWQKVVPKADSTPVQRPVESVMESSFGMSSKRPSNGPPQAHSNDKENKKQIEPARSVSSPGMTGSSNAPPPQIQSIRHTPAPARSSSWLDARTSMADILSQQLYEKIAVKESAAKRSLDEIQQEQTFQEWWELESLKVQEEEAAVIAAAMRLAKGANNRGGRRKPPGNTDRKLHGEKRIDTSDARPVQAEGSARGSSRGRGGKAGIRGGRYSNKST